MVAPLLQATIGAAFGSAVLGLVLRDFRLGPAWPALGWLALLALTSQLVGWLLITMSMPGLPAWLVGVLLLVQPAGVVIAASGAGRNARRGGREERRGGRRRTVPQPVPGVDR